MLLFLIEKIFIEKLQWLLNQIQIFVVAFLLNHILSHHSSESITTFAMCKSSLKYRQALLFWCEK